MNLERRAGNGRKVMDGMWKCGIGSGFIGKADKWIIIIIIIGGRSVKVSLNGVEIL